MKHTWNIGARTASSSIRTFSACASCWKRRVGVRLDLGALDQPVVLRVRETALVERRVRGPYFEEVDRVVVGSAPAAVVEVVVARRRLLEKTVEGQRPHLDFGPEVFLELGLQEGPDVPLPAR